jgi:hypothetical protein
MIVVQIDKFFSTQVFCVEDTAQSYFCFTDLLNNYIMPTLDHFCPSQRADVEWATVEASSTLSLVLFRSSDSVPG